MKNLTEKELQTLHLVSIGMENKDIAESFRCSVNTVATHLRNIYQKLDVRNRTEAVHVWQENILGGTENGN